MVEDQISVDSMTEVLHFRKYVFLIFFAQGRREDQYHSYGKYEATASSWLA